MPKVTAIVSAYYSEPYLEGRLENLYHQSLRPEIIVVAQDGSADAQIAANWRAQYSDLASFQLILTPEIPTIYAAWNMAIEAAHGQFLTSANTDDRFYPDALKKMAWMLEKKDEAALVYAEVDIIDKPDGEPIGRYTWAEGGFKELLNGCFVGPMPMWRKSLHDKYGLFDASLHVAGDYEMWLRITQKGERLLKMTTEPLGVYLQRKDSAEHRQKVRTIQETSRVRSKYGAFSRG
jgi:glycosyltransferase involved in cell wall biosynthesis